MDNLDRIRKEQYSWESNDCTVVALALAAQIHYKDAWSRFAISGRCNCRGFHFDNWARKQEGKTINGYQLVRVSNWEPTGRFIVTIQVSRTAGHAFAVIDGKALDLVKIRPNVRIKSVWKLVRQ